MSTNLSTAIQRAGGTMTGTLNGPTFNATTSIQTGGVTRIDASGNLSNINVPSGATTVNIDASRITTGTLPSSLFPAASSNVAGIVQLSDSVTAPSSSIAASSSAVSGAWNLASNALPTSGGTISGSLTVQTAFTGPSFSIQWIGSGSLSGTDGNLYYTSANIATTVLANSPGYGTAIFMGSNIVVPVAGTYCLTASTYVFNNQASIVSFNQGHSITILRSTASSSASNLAVSQVNGNNAYGTWCTASWTGYVSSSTRLHVNGYSIDYDRGGYVSRIINNANVTLTKIL